MHQRHSDEAAGPTLPAGSAAGEIADVTAKLTAIFAKVLELDDTRPEDDFFELGGHSLLATEVVALASAALGRRIPVHAVFTQPTPAGLAAALISGEIAEEAPIERAARTVVDEPD